MCAFLCTLFLHSSAVLFLVCHSHSSTFPMFLCILGKISQMYMLWSGKNLGFSSFFNEKLEKRDKPTREQPVALSKEMSTCTFWVWLKQIPKCWFPTTLISTDISLLLPSLQVCLCAKSEPQTLRESKTRMAGCEDNLSGHGRLNVSYHDLTCSLPSCSVATIRKYTLPFIRNVVRYEPVSYIPVENFKFSESVKPILVLIM